MAKSTKSRKSGKAARKHAGAAKKAAPRKAKAAKSTAKSTAKSAVKAARKPAAKAAAKKTVAKTVKNGVPRPSSKAWGEAGRALDGVKVLDFTHVQSGPTCTQLLGYMGADVIKIERPGVGDITRGQLRDVPNADSLYFTMLNGNKRSITIDSKNPKGMEIIERLIRHCDVLVENFAPGALDRMGLTFERINKINPRMIVASIKGFGPGPYEDCKVYENVAQCAGGAASTTGFREGPPVVTGAQIGDSGTGLHLALGIVMALYQRIRTGRGQRIQCAMQDGVLNLCRVKLRDQQRLAHGPLTEYSQYGEGIPFGKAVPRAGNDSGGGQPGWILKCKGWEDDPDAYIYFITQAPVWGAICDVIGKPEWKSEPDYATPKARLPRLREIFDTIEQWTITKDKFEAMDILNKYDIPCGPILSMKEIAEDESLRATGTVVEVDHPVRGKYLTVGHPVKMSDSIPEVRRAPLLGEHTEEILTRCSAIRPRTWRPSRRRARSRRRRSPRRRRRPDDARIVGPPVRSAASRPATSPSPGGGGIAPRTWERTFMRIVVHGQQAFGKAVLEALLKRGENVIAVYVAPEKPGQKADPLKEAALAAKLPVYQPASYRKPEVWEEFRALKPTCR